MRGPGEGDARAVQDEHPAIGIQRALQIGGNPAHHPVDRQRGAARLVEIDRLVRRRREVLPVDVEDIALLVDSRRRPPAWLIVPWPPVTWPPVGPASAIPPAPSSTAPLNSTIRQEETSWRFLFRHRFQRNSTWPSRIWKLSIMARPHLGRHCRSYVRHQTTFDRLSDSEMIPVRMIIVTFYGTHCTRLQAGGRPDWPCQDLMLWTAPPPARKCH